MVFLSVPKGPKKRRTECDIGVGVERRVSGSTGRGRHRAIAATVVDRCGEGTGSRK